MANVGGQEKNYYEIDGVVTSLRKRESADVSMKGIEVGGLER